MFSEKKFINDFIEANYRSNQESEEDIDYEYIKWQISTYCEDVIDSCTAEDFKFIAILYNGNTVTTDYETVATNSLHKLCHKVLSEYIDHESSDADTDYDDYDDGNDDDYEHEFYPF
jgi:hypothetical protein